MGMMAAGIVGMITSAVSATLSGISAIQQGNAQAKAYDAQARAAVIQGQSSLESARLQAAQQHQQALRLQSTQIAQAAGAGLDVGSATSSLYDITTDTQNQARREREIMLAQGRADYANAMVAAANYRAAGKSAKRAGLIQGIGSIAGSVYSAYNAGAFSGLFGSETSAVTPGIGAARVNSASTLSPVQGGFVNPYNISKASSALTSVYGF